MSSSPGSDIVNISPPTVHHSLAASESADNAPNDTDSKEALVQHLERAGALELDIKPTSMVGDSLTRSNGDHGKSQLPKKEKDVSSSEEEVRRKMEETVQNIRDKADRLQAAAQPYAEKTRSFAENQPVLFTFLVIFGFFSAIPILCFGTFLLGATLFVLSVAAIGICVSLFFTILVAGSILVPVLFITFLFSTGCLTFLLSLFLVHRLYLHISAACTVDPPPSSDRDRDDEGIDGQVKSVQKEYSYERIASGISGWVGETEARVLPARYLVFAPAPDTVDQEDGDEMQRHVKEEDGTSSEMTLVGELVDVKVEPVERGGKRVRWSVSEGSQAPTVGGKGEQADGAGKAGVKA